MLRSKNDARKRPTDTALEMTPGQLLTLHELLVDVLPAVELLSNVDPEALCTVVHDEGTVSAIIVASMDVDE